MKKPIIGFTETRKLVGISSWYALRVTTSVMKTPKITPRRIKCAICVDLMGSSHGTPEQEIVLHQKELKTHLKPHRLDFYRADHCGVGIAHGIRPGTNLIAFDYGGMLLGNSLAEHNSRALIKWAQDNPNGLVLVMSAFTYANTIANELYDMGLEQLHNVCNYYGDLEGVIPDWFMHGTNT